MDEKPEFERNDVKVHGSANAILWKDKTEVGILTKINQPPAEGNFCDEKKQPIVEYYNRHKGYNAQSDQMVNSYSIPSSGQQNFVSAFYRGGGKMSLITPPPRW
jgi:hypothetical protein